VQIVYSSNGATCELDLGEAWRVNLHDELIQSLSDWLRPENVQIVYQPAAQYSP
jgi:DNA polymerase-3 subunit alpha